MKTYDIVRVFFKFKLGRVTFQLRRLKMLSEPSGLTTVFTVSTETKKS